MSKITDYRIIIPSCPLRAERRAAAFLREKIKLICGKSIDILPDMAEPTALEIVLGCTNRETLDGIDLKRNPRGDWEYIIKKYGDRLYLTSCTDSKEQKNDESSVGTVMAAYRFVEKILGYDFLNSAYEAYEEKPDLEMPSEYEFIFTREKLRAQEPMLFDGAAMYVTNCAEDINWNCQGMIFKTRSGKLIVMDGGQPYETDRFIRILQKISGEDVPHVTAWIFSHMHPDHWGVYDTLCRLPEYHHKVKVDDFYCNLLTEEFYSTLCAEPQQVFLPPRARYLASENTVGAKVHTVEKGDLITVDEIEIEVLHVPELKHARRMNVNDSSVVYKLTYDKKQTIMLLGDAEEVCNEDLLETMSHKLKSDVVQVGHHGCGNVSRKCYRAIDADAYIWPVGERFWYSDNGSELNTHNTGVLRSRDYMMAEKPPKPENVYVVIDDILSLPLPMPIY